jgi:DNA-binding winged helix-turn-helix (wHTH) protein/Tfp pilus assembly protein PilF
VRVWRAGDLLIDTALRRVERNGERLVLQDIPFGILLCLLEREGLPVTRKELQEQFWAAYDWDSFERSLNTAMRKLRQAIGDDARAPRLIETMRASGYRWIGAPVEFAATDPSTPPSPAVQKPRIAIRRTIWTIGLCTVLMALAAAWLGRAKTSLEIDAPERDTLGHPILPVLRDRLAKTPGLASVELVDNRQGRGSVARVRRGSMETLVPLRNNPEAIEELIVNAALGEGAHHSRAPAALPAQAQQELMEASSSLMMPDPDIDTARRAADQLSRITAQAPTHSGAWLALARAEQILASKDSAPVQHRQAARVAIRHAVAADPRSLAATIAMARHLFWNEWDDANAWRWLAIAQVMAPNDPHVLHVLAWMELSAGHGVKALEHISAAAAANPLDGELQSDWGWFYYRTGDFEAARRQCHHAAQLPRPDSSAVECESRSLAMLKRFDEAWALVFKTDSSWLDAATKARLGNLPAQQAYSEAMVLAANKWRSKPSGHYMAAIHYAIANEAPLARSELLAAIQAREPLARLTRATPELATLSGDPEITKLLQ